MEVTIKENQGFYIISPKGSVDLATSPIFRDELQKLLKEKAPCIFVDLHSVDYIDSSGIATLVEAYQILKEYDGKLLLFGLGLEIRDIFELARLDRVFAIYDDFEGALNGLKRGES